MSAKACRAGCPVISSHTAPSQPIAETVSTAVVQKRQGVAPRRQLREEPVGFQVVSQVVGLFAGAASAVAYRPWVLPAKLGDSSRSRRSQPVHRGLDR